MFDVSLETCLQNRNVVVDNDYVDHKFCKSIMIM